MAAIFPWTRVVGNHVTRVNLLTLLFGFDPDLDSSGKLTSIRLRTGQSLAVANWPFETRRPVVFQ